MKNKLLVFGAIVCLAAILAAGTLAYFTDDVVTHNVITSSEIDISVQENVPNGKPIVDPETKEITGYSIEGVMPKTTETKEVKVRNDSMQTAWIRVQLTHVIKNKAGTKMPNAVDGVELIQYPIPEEVKDNWIEKDGWYYYTKPVSGGAATSLLIKEVKFAPEMDNPYQECTVELSVNAQAVQYVHNGDETDNVMDARGWPKAPAN